MIYTSYFGNPLLRNTDMVKVSVARGLPKSIKGVGTATEFIPPKHILLCYKRGDITKEEFTWFYNKKLKDLNPHKLYQKYDGSIFLCYESPSNFCHRKLIRRWFKKHELPCEEYEYSRASKIEKGNPLLRDVHFNK